MSKALAALFALAALVWTVASAPGRSALPLTGGAPEVEAVPALPQGPLFAGMGPETDIGWLMHDSDRASLERYASTQLGDTLDFAVAETIATGPNGSGTTEQLVQDALAAFDRSQFASSRLRISALAGGSRGLPKNPTPGGETGSGDQPGVTPGPSTPEEAQPEEPAPEPSPQPPDESQPETPPVEPETPPAPEEPQSPDPGPQTPDPTPQTPDNESPPDNTNPEPEPPVVVPPIDIPETNPPPVNVPEPGTLGLLALGLLGLGATRRRRQRLS